MMLMLVRFGLVDVERIAPIGLEQTVLIRPTLALPTALRGQEHSVKHGRYTHASATRGCVLAELEMLVTRYE